MALDKEELEILDGFFNSIGRTKAWELLKKSLQRFSKNEDDDKFEKSQAISEILQIANENKDTIQELTERINEISSGSSGGSVEINEVLNLANENKAAIEELIEKIDLAFDGVPISDLEIDDMFE